MPPEQLGGTVQNDILKEYIAQHAWIFPPRPAMRLVTDMIEFCRRARAAAGTPISISGYHIREAGATAAQELAFTLADGFGYVECGARARPRRRRLRAAAVVLLRRRTTTSSRRSPSSARPGGSGRAIMRSASARRIRALDAAALPHADGGRVAHRAAAATTTSCASRSRRWRRCSAARSRCTPTRSTRRWRCRPRRRCGSRCARSRSSPTRRGVDEHDRSARRRPTSSRR